MTHNQQASLVLDPCQTDDVVFANQVAGQSSPWPTASRPVKSLAHGQQASLVLVLCQTDDNVFADQYHHDNHCIVSGGVEAKIYSGCCGSSGGEHRPSKCDAAELHAHFYRTFNNSIYTDDGVLPGAAMASLFSAGAEKCAGWKEWQAAAMDAGSTVQPIPAADEIVAMGRAILT